MHPRKFHAAKDETDLNWDQKARFLKARRAREEKERMKNEPNRLAGAPWWTASSRPVSVARSCGGTRGGHCPKKSVQPKVAPSHAAWTPWCGPGRSFFFFFNFPTFSTLSRHGLRSRTSNCSRGDARRVRHSSVTLPFKFRKDFQTRGAVQARAVQLRRRRPRHTNSREACAKIPLRGMGLESLVFGT